MSAHAKHVIWSIVAVLAFSFGLAAYWKHVNHEDGVAHDQRVIAEEQLKQDKLAQSAAEKQADQDRKAYDLLKIQLDAQNAHLRGQIASLAASLQVRQEQDRALPLPELGQRLSGLVGAIPGDVKAVPDGLMLGTDSARKTVVLLEEVPADRETIQRQSQIIENKDSEIQKQADLVNSSANALDACKKAQVSADTACNARLKEQAAKAKKHGLIYNLLSFAAGMVLGHRM